MSSRPSSEFRTSVSVNWQEDGFLRTRILPGAEQKLADAIEHITAIRTYVGDRWPPLLVDMRSMKSQDRDARQYYGSAEVAESACALALLVESRVTMLIANFFISVTKVSTPTKIFTDEAEALAWLKGFLA